LCPDVESCVRTPAFLTLNRECAASRDLDRAGCECVASPAEKGYLRPASQTLRAGRQTRLCQARLRCFSDPKVRRPYSLFALNAFPMLSAMVTNSEGMNTIVVVCCSAPPR
jgi:hypothetical protein